METEACIQKRYGVISFTSFIIGIICFFTVFITPIRMENIGNMNGDYITFFLTIAGIVLSVIGIFEENGEKSDFYHFFGFFLVFLYILGYRHHFVVNWGNRITP